MLARILDFLQTTPEPWALAILYFAGAFAAHFVLTRLARRSFMRRASFINIFAVAFFLLPLYSIGYYGLSWLWLLAFLAVGGAVFIALVYQAWNALILRPGARLIRLLEDLARGDGDLKSRLEGQQERTEFGQIAELFNQFLEKLRFVIIHIQHTSAKTATSAGRLNEGADAFARTAEEQATMVEEITAATEQVTASAENVAAVSARQRSAVSAVDREVQELSDSINDIGARLGEVSEQTERISLEARAGSESLDTMSARMQRIGHSSGEMIDIIGIISGISDRVNLLALNASIEAARAGEYGRGFAVVAEEVSRLADQTAESIKGIDELIQKNRQEIEAGREITDRAVASIKNILQGVERVNGNISEVSERLPRQLHLNRNVKQSLGSLTDLSGQVESIGAEQKKAMDEIVNTMENISRLTQRNAEGAREMYRNSDEVSAMADKLKHEISFFQT